MTFKNLLAALVLSSSIFAVTGCDTAKELFGEEQKPRLEGERISVLQYQNELEPDPILASTQMQLPSSWENSFWPQFGGYPSHSMGHLNLSHPLKRQWDVSIGKAGKRNKPLSVQPVVADGMIFTLDASAKLSAFDTETGKKRWSKELAPKDEEEIGTIGGGLAFSDGSLFVTSGYQQILAVDPNSGNVLWAQKTTSPTRSAPAVLSGRVFVITLDNHIQAFNTKDGAPIWNYSGVQETTNLLGSSSPAINKNITIAALSSGEILALRTENGQTLWQDNLSSLKKYGALPGISDIRGLPVIDRGIVYIIGSSGRMLALDEHTGRRLWQKEIGGAETPWPAGDTVFTLTSNQQLVALGRHSGQIHWVTQLPSLENNDDPNDPLVWTGPVLGGNHLILASSKGDLILLNPTDGKAKAKMRFDDGTVIPPIIADDRLYILTQDAELIAFGAE